MKKTITLLGILLILPHLFAQQKPIPIFALDFKLLNKTIKPYQYFDPTAPAFWAQVSLTNINGRMWHTGKYLPFGWKGGLYPFYLEATDLQGKEIDIRFNGTYSLAASPAEIDLDKGKTITDTLNIPVVYSFKKAGVYKVRAVFNSYLAYGSRSNQVNYGLVYSNWDTVYVRE